MSTPSTTSSDATATSLLDVAPGGHPPLPQQVHLLQRQDDELLAGHRHAGALRLLARAPAAVAGQPVPQRRLPGRERLQHGALAAVVRAGQHGHVAQRDPLVGEPLEAGAS